jgi:hypothetical protein
MIFTYLSVLNLFILGIYKPAAESKLQKMEFFNEFFIFLSGMGTFFLTNLTSGYIKKVNAAYCILAFTLIVIFTNLMLIIYENIMGVYNMIRKKKEKKEDNKVLPIIESPI